VLVATDDRRVEKYWAYCLSLLLDETRSRSSRWT